MRVLLAVGDPNYVQILRGHLVGIGFDVIENDVFHRRFLQEIIEMEQPDTVILHDTFLPSDFDSKDEQEEEILSLIEYWRIQYRDRIRVVYLCHREKSDPFLGKLVARNVLDIFYTRSIPTQLLLEQLKKPAEFANVARLGVGIYEFQEEEIEEVEEDGNQENMITPSADEEEEEKPTKGILERLPKIPQFHNPLKDKKIVVERPTIQKQTFKKEIKIHFGRNQVKTIGVSLPRQLFVVAGWQPRVGSTFIAHQMAYAFSTHEIGVTYMENPYRRPYTYERLDGEIKQPEYRSLFQRISTPERNTPKMFLQTHEIDFVVPNPLHEPIYSEDALNVDDVLRLLLSVHETPIVFVDIGDDLSSVFAKEMMSVANKVFFVLDHDIPGAIRYNQDTLSPERFLVEQLKSENRFQFIANRSIAIKQSKEMFEEDVFYYPDIPADVVYHSQLEGTLQFKDRQWKRKQIELIMPLLEDVIPKEVRKKRSSKLFGL